MIKRFIIFFTLIFVGIYLYNIFPSYKEYIKGILFGPEPLVKKNNISKTLQFNDNISITNPILFLSEIYHFNISDTKNFIEFKTDKLEYIENIRFVIGDYPKIRVKSIKYNKDKTVTVKNKYRELTKIGKIIEVEYKTSKGYKKEGNISLSLKRIIEGYYDYIYIKTDKRYIFNISFKKKKGKNNSEFKTLGQMYEYLLKNYTLY